MCQFEEKMESFFAANVCLFLVCCICCCISDKPTDSEPNLYVKRVLSEFENRYEALRMELKSEIENRKESEANLKNEINELNYDRLQHLNEISTLKSEQELSKKEVGSLKLRLDKYETVNSQRWSFDVTIKQFYPEEIPELHDESKTTVEQSSEFSMQTNRDHIGKESVARKDTFQSMHDPIGPRIATANVQHPNDKGLTTRGISIHFVIYNVSEKTIRLLLSKTLLLMVTETVIVLCGNFIINSSQYWQIKVL